MSRRCRRQVVRNVSAEEVTCPHLGCRNARARAYGASTYLPKRSPEIEAMTPVSGHNAGERMQALPRKL